MRPLFKMLPMLALTGLVGCAVTDETNAPKDIPQPTLGESSKDDSLRSVDRQGVLPFGEAIEASFEESLTFHGYEFSALAGGEVSIEVTQRGSSRGLDTTMWLYGMTPEDGWEMIAFDDDEGWGTLSRLRDLELGDHGDYMIVVGTADGMGLGNYRVELTCTNDACVGDDTVPLGQFEMPPTLAPLAQALSDAANAGGTNTASLEGWTVPDGASTEEVAEAVRLNYGRVNDLYLGEPMDQADYRMEDYLPEVILDALEGEHGTNYRGLRIRGMYLLDSGEEEFVSIEVIHYPDLNITYAITYVAPG